MAAVLLPFITKHLETGQGRFDVNAPIRPRASHQESLLFNSCQIWHESCQLIGYFFFFCTVSQLKTNGAWCQCVCLIRPKGYRQSLWDKGNDRVRNATFSCVRPEVAVGFAQGLCRCARCSICVGHSSDEYFVKYNEMKQCRFHLPVHLGYGDSYILLLACVLPVRTLYADGIQRSFEPGHYKLKRIRKFLKMSSLLPPQEQGFLIQILNV